ncbi:PAS domain-containing protein, partial [Sulfurimonas sp. MAG313]
MIFKFLSALLYFFCIPLFADSIELTQMEKIWIKSNTTISYAGDPNWLPYEAFNNEGKYIGIVADHLSYIQKKTGLNFVPQRTKNWEESLKIATQGKVSIVSGDAADEVLAKNFKPIEPYLINPIVIVMPVETNYIDDLNELQGKHIAIMKDYGYTADLYKHYPQMHFIEVTNIQDGLRGISSGKYDALLASNSLARYSISSMDLNKIKIVGKTTVTMEVTLFVDKDMPILFNIINKTIQSISAEEQNRIIKKWTLSSPSTFTKTSFIIIGVLITLLVSFSLYTIVMKRENKKQRLHMRKLESAQKVGHLGSWEWNMITNVLIWSDEVYRIFGEEPQSFPATYDAFKSYIPEKFHKGLETAISKAIQSHAPYEFDHQIIQKDGSLRLVREAGYIRYDDENQPVSMLGTILDIDSVTRAQTTSKENKELIELLEKFDHNVIASNTDLKGTITYASKALCDISGYSVDELLGQAQSIVRHPDTPSNIFENLWNTIQSGKTWEGELKNKTKEGGEYWVHTTISPNYDENGNINGYSAIRRDITHEKKVEDLHLSLKVKSTQLQRLNNELEKRIK